MLFFLVCTGALFWGVTNVLRKYYLNRGAKEEVMTVATMLGGAVSPFLVQFIWLGIPQISSGFWWPIAVTSFLNIGIQYWGVKAQKLEDPSVFASLQGVTPIFVVLTSWILLREFPTIFGLVGIGLIVIGTYVLGLKGYTAKGPANQRFTALVTPWLRLSSSKGARLALLTAFLGSIALNFDKMAVSNANPMIFVGILFSVVGIFLYGYFQIIGRWKELDKRYFWHLFLIGFLVLGGANILMSWGFFYGIVPYVGALKRTIIPWTVILAGIFLKEKFTGPRLIAAAIIVAGVFLIAF